MFPNPIREGPFLVAYQRVNRESTVVSGKYVNTNYYIISYCIIFFCLFSSVAEPKSVEPKLF